MKVGKTCLKGHPNKHSISFKSLFKRHLNKDSRNVKKGCYFKPDYNVIDIIS